MICLRSSNVGYQPLGRVSWQRPSPALLYGGTTARILPPPNPKNCRALLRQIFLAVQRGPSSHLLDLQPLVRSGLLTTKGNLITDYPQPRRWSTNQEHTTGSAGL